VVARSNAHRGIALVMVLFAILVIGVVMGVTLQRLLTQQQIELSDASARLGDRLLVAADELIDVWLRTQSSDVILPSDVSEPVVAVLHDQLNAVPLHGRRSGDIEIRLTAWDQRGMVPAQLRRGASPLRMALHPDHLRLLDRCVGPRYFDFLAASEESGTNVSLFPAPVRGTKVLFGDDVPQTDPVPAASRDFDRLQGVLAAISPQVRGEDTSILINIHTAPAALLDPAYREAGRGGIEQVLSMRDQGVSVPLADPDISGRAAPRVRLVGRSDAWAFRVDIRVADVQRSWWMVYHYVSAAAPDAGESAWKRVLTLPIDSADAIVPWADDTADQMSVAAQRWAMRGAAP